MTEKELKASKRTLVFMCVWYSLLAVVTILFSLGVLDGFFVSQGIVKNGAAEVQQSELQALSAGEAENYEEQEQELMNRYQASEASNEKQISNQNARAYGKVMGAFFAALLPTILLFFATRAPFDLSKGLRAALIVIWVLATVLLGICFFDICAENRSVLSASSEEWDDAFMFPFSFIVGIVGFVAVYLLSGARLNLEALKKTETKDMDSDGWIGFVVKDILIPVLNFFKAILRFKEKHIYLFLIVATVLLTALLMPLSMVIVVLAAIMLIIGFISFVTGAYKAGDTTVRYAYTVNDGGYTRTLNYYEYDSVHSRDRYRDDLGNYWYTTDNGSTFTKDSRF